MANKIKYDPEIIEAYAKSLYAQARSIIISSTVLGILVGAIAGAAVFFVTNTPDSRTQGFEPMGIFGGILGAVLGYSSAQAKAFALRMQAQTALCQVQIEKNTRKIEPPTLPPA